MIGGPNDVLVKSQINRAVVPARESNQASPLLVPSTPVRRTEVAALPASPAVAEPPPKVAAKVAASPRRPHRSRLRRPPRPWRRRFRSRPLPSRRLLPFPVNRPFLSKPQPEPARSASAPPAATQAAEPARPAPANPPPRQATRRAPTTARDHAPANHPRQRLAQSRGAGSRYGNSSRKRPGQFLGPISCRACAAAPRGEGRTGSRWLENGVHRSNGESGAARGANSDDRPAGQRGLGPSAAGAEDGPVRARVRLGAKISRRAPASGQDERRAERQAVAQSRRSLRRPRFARG